MGLQRVLVTRAAEDAESLCEALRTRGLLPVCVPLLHREPRSSAFENVAWDSFDWWLLTSAAVVDVLELASAPRNTPAKIAAVGRKTAARAASAGFHITLVPTVSTGVGVVAAMGDLAGTSILYPHALEAEPGTAEALAAAGASVTHVIAYENVEPPDVAERLRTVWPVDVITLLSGSAARRFASAAREAKIALDARVVVLGPSTEAVARSCGLRVDAVAEPQTVEGVANAAAKVAFTPPA